MTDHDAKDDSAGGPCMTDQSRQEWLEARKKGLGGSDIAALAGLSKWTTPYQLWLDKTGQAEPEPEEEPPHLYWGRRLEDLVADEYRVRTGRKIQRVNAMLVKPDAPYMLANLDRAVVNEEIAGNVRWKDGRLTTDRILECKTAHAFAKDQWGEPGSDDVPVPYLIQTQWYLGVTGCEVADIAVLIGGSDFRLYEIARDEALISDLEALASDFWHKHVVGGVAPDPQTVADAVHRFPRHVAAKEKPIGLSARDACIRLVQIAEDEKRLKAEAEDLKARVMAEMGDAEAAVETIGEPALATWKAQTTRRLDQKALREDHPEIAQLYTTETQSRVFRLGKAAKEAIRE